MLNSQKDRAHLPLPAARDIRLDISHKLFYIIHFFHHTGRHMALLFFCLFVIFTLMVLYHHLPFRIWELGTAIYLLSTLFTPMSWFVAIFLWICFGGVIACLRLPALRAAVTRHAFEHAKTSIPHLSKTEEESLNTGDTWVEQSIFQGGPDWDHIKGSLLPLTEEEQSFLDI
jgi:acyl-CoA dehydrogenase